MRNQKGITLVALVVTIVVLLILAGVSLAMLTGDNGIITNSQKASASNTESEAVEKMGIAYNAAKTDSMVKMATVVGYQPNQAASIEALAQTVATELGTTLTVVDQAADIPSATVAPTIDTELYSVYLDKTAGKIVMIYDDSTFSLATNAADGSSNEPANNKYPAVRGEITVTTTSVNYTVVPSKTVK